MEKTAVSGDGRVPAPLPGAGKAPPPPAAAAAAVRVLPVANGQAFGATVVATEGEVVWLAWRGGVFAARTSRPLRAGHAYDFVVAATEPHVLLNVATPAPEAAAVRVAATGGSELLRLLTDWVAEARVPAGTVAPEPGDARRTAQQELALLLRAFAARPAAADLLALDRGLGHEQEARVLRLLAAPAAAAESAAAGLRRSAKSAALQEAAPAAGSGDRRTAAARALVDGLNGIERDNAQRRVEGLPLWLPLPADPAAGLLQARMFVVLPGGKEAPARAIAGDDAFTIVLLLDLSRLGELRVDLTVRDSALSGTFLAARPATTLVLNRELDALRSLLEQAGLRVGSLRVQQAPEQGLPVADLLLPPRDGRSVVDVHA